MIVHTQAKLVTGFEPSHSGERIFSFRAALTLLLDFHWLLSVFSVFDLLFLAVLWGLRQGLQCQNLTHALPGLHHLSLTPCPHLITPIGKVSTIQAGVIPSA